LAEPGGTTDIADPSAPPPNGGRRFAPSAPAIRDWVAANAIILVLAVLIVGIALIDSDFVALTNLRNILLNASTRLIIALGAGLVLISRGVDLSAGRMVGLAAVVSASMLQTEEYARRFLPDLVPMPVLVPILIAVGLCVLFGVLNGIVIARFGVPPFIATLGMMVIVYGANAIYFDTAPNNSQPIGGLRGDFTALGTGAVGTGEFSVPYLVLIAVVTAILFWVVLNKTVFGKNVYAIGGNPQAAQVSGIDITRNLIFVYALAGATYGLGGVLEAARTGGANSTYGTLYELDAIAACVVGGVSTAGGIGRVGGITAGVLVFGVINYGLTFIGINPFWQQIIKGTIIIGAVAFDIARNQRRR
jgi:methyl-galactoside transport system permease protein